MAEIEQEQTQTAKQGAGYFAPESWSTYQGQEKVKNRLQIKIQAAMERYEQMDHCLILGASGSGKTSLAKLIAGEHGKPFLYIMITPGFSQDKLSNLLIAFDEDGGGICMLDEIHCFNTKQQHFLYSILEEGCISYNTGKRYYFKSEITIVAATTDENDLSEALRGRFGAPYRLEDYSDLDMARIIERMAHKVGVQGDRDSYLALGRAAAGSPRQAADLVKTARDLGTMQPEPILLLSEITPDGLTIDHIAYLKALRDLGGIAGKDAIANISGRAKEDIPKLEKLLVKKLFVEQTNKGRQLTHQGLNALKKLEKTHANLL